MGLPGWHPQEHMEKAAIPRAPGVLLINPGNGAMLKCDWCYSETKKDRWLPCKGNSALCIVI